MRRIGLREAGRPQKQAAQNRQKGLERFKGELAKMGDQDLLETLWIASEKTHLEAQRATPMSVLRLQDSAYPLASARQRLP